MGRRAGADAKEVNVTICARGMLALFVNIQCRRTHHSYHHPLSFCKQSQVADNHSTMASTVSSNPSVLSDFDSVVEVATAKNIVFPDKSKLHFRGLLPELRRHIYLDTLAINLHLVARAALGESGKVVNSRQSAF